MVRRILIDTNVLLDYLLTREPFYEDAKKIVMACTDGEIKGCIAAHSISNMYFILRKDYSAKERREILINLFKIFDTEGIDQDKLLSGLQNEKFSDFEDCLQMECAKSYGAKYIVTRNIEDFKYSEVKAILPMDYLKLKEVPFCVETPDFNQSTLDAVEDAGYISHEPDTKGDTSMDELKKDLEE